MSRVVFMGYPFYGHTNPTIGLVKELVRRGEEVFYYSGEKFRHLIEGAGAVFYDYHYDLPDNDIDIENVGRNDGLPKNGFEVLGHMAVGLAEECLFKVEHCFDNIQKISPEYIIHDSFAFCGKVIARRLKIPTVSSITTFAYSKECLVQNPDDFLNHVLRMPRNEVTAKYKPGIYLRMVEMLNNMLKKQYGFDEDFHVLDLMSCKAGLNIVYTSKEFQVDAECFDESYKFIGPSIDEARAGGNEFEFPFESIYQKPLIYISFGSMLGINNTFYDKFYEAFADTEMTVILSAGKYFEKIRQHKIPANFIVRKFVPQIEILQKADIFITHGGFNSTCESLYYGVPMLVIPQTTDQFLVAHQVETLGCGKCLRNEECGVDNLKAAVEKILSDKKIVDTVNKIGDSFRMAGGFKKAADEIFNHKSQWER